MSRTKLVLEKPRVSLTTLTQLIRSNATSLNDEKEEE